MANNLWLLNTLTKEKGNVNYFSIDQYWKNHGIPPLFDQSEKVLQCTFVTTTGVIDHKYVSQQQILKTVSMVVLILTSLKA
jgi:hypothetical protein